MLSFLLLITLIVFIHELGHYLVARITNVKVEKFSVGFGKEIIGFTDKNNTRWSLNAIPVGADVKLYGTNKIVNEDTSLPISNQAFDNKSLLAKISITAAGPLANIILALFLFFGIFSLSGLYKINEEAFKIQKELLENIGLKKGEMLLAIEDKSITSWKELKDYFLEQKNQNIEITVKNNNAKNYNRIISKEKFFVTGENGIKKSLADIPVNIFEPVKVELSVVESAKYSFLKVYQLFKLMSSSIYKLIAGEEGANQIAGVISMAKLSSKYYDSGVYSFASYIAILSVNLAFINLLPIPGLDGGHIMLYLIELIRGKPLNNKFVTKFLLSGYMFLVLLTIFTIFNDLFKIAI